MCKIDQNFCFRTGGYSIKEVKESLSYYNNNSKDRNDWVFNDKDTLIFVDTNVLLNLYEISEQERNEILSFLKTNSARVFIPFQVQREYLRRRLYQIQKRLSKLENLMLETKSDMSDFWTSIKNIEGKIYGKMNQGVIKFGMPNTYKAYCELSKLMNTNIFSEELHERIDSLTNRIKDAIEVETGEAKRKSKFNYDDPILEALSELNVLSELSAEEANFICKLYKELKSTYDSVDTKENIKDVFTFPGAGDKSKSVDDDIEKSVAWADLYIYHELLLKMKAMGKDALFLTREKSKGDWMERDTCNQYPHYITNAHVLTGHMLYILNAERFMAPSFTREIESQDLENESEVDSESIETSISSISEDHLSELNGVNDSSQRNEILEPQDSKDLHTSTLTKSAEEFLLIKQARKTKKWRDITEKEFIDNLKFSLCWARDFGQGYVAENYFIYDILGYKNAYEKNAAREMLAKLVSDGKVKEGTHDNGDYSFTTLELVNTDNE